VVAVKVTEHRELDKELYKEDLGSRNPERQSDM